LTSQRIKWRRISVGLRLKKNIKNNGLPNNSMKKFGKTETIFSLVYLVALAVSHTPQLNKFKTRSHKSHHHMWLLHFSALLFFLGRIKEHNFDSVTVHRVLFIFNFHFVFYFCKNWNVPSKSKHDLSQWWKGTCGFGAF
jgi:hypothetical protein